MPGAIVIGAGPGIGTSVAQRLAREGLPVGVLARSPATVDAALAALADSDVLGELTGPQHLAAWAVNVGGAISAVAHLGPAMARAAVARSCSPAACPSRCPT
jgi:NAD(P)-dependent dehydrogenase (short-subunit alcohol dehydrogenase family)